MRQPLRCTGALVALLGMSAPVGAAHRAVSPTAPCDASRTDSDCWPKTNWICFVGLIPMDHYCDRSLVPEHCPF